MLRRIIVALIDLLAVVNGPKWLFEGKRLPTLGLDHGCAICGPLAKCGLRLQILWPAKRIGNVVVKTLFGGDQYF